MTLQPTFALTPRDSYYGPAPLTQAHLHIYGAYFGPKWYEGHPHCYDSLHEADEIFFSTRLGADPTINYSIWPHRKMVPHIQLYYDLRSLGANKELALVFGFRAASNSRLLVFSSAGKLEDVRLVPGDNQFLIEVESLNPLYLFFIHTWLEPHLRGGSWFFKGITGYVI